MSSHVVDHAPLDQALAPGDVQAGGSAAAKGAGENQVDEITAPPGEGEEGVARGRGAVGNGGLASITDGGGVALEPDWSGQRVRYCGRDGVSRAALDIDAGHVAC